MPTVLCLETLAKRVVSTNTDKVWVGAVVQLDGNQGWRVALHWGRRGTKGQGKQYHYTSFEGARTSWKRRVQGQLDDGYKQIDWQDGSYGLRSFVQSLGDLEGLSGPNAPAAVTQAPKPPPKPSGLSDKIWDLSQKGLPTQTIAKQLNMLHSVVISNLEVRLKKEKLLWQGNGMPPHHVIIGHGRALADGTPICSLCYQAVAGPMHIEWLKAHPHKFVQRAGFDTCYCNGVQSFVLHTMTIKLKQPSPTTPPQPQTPSPPQTVAPTPEAPIPAPVAPVNLESETRKEPRAPIVLPNRRRERAPRGGF